MYINLASNKKVEIKIKRFYLHKKRIEFVGYLDMGWNILYCMRTKFVSSAVLSKYEDSKTEPTLD